MSTENHDLYRPASAATAAIEAMIAQHWSTTPVPEAYTPISPLESGSDSSTRTPAPRPSSIPDLSK